MFGNAHGTYYGTGNASIFGWYGYALHKVVRALAELLYLVETRAQTRGLMRASAVAVEIVDTYVSARYLARLWDEAVESVETSKVARALARVKDAATYILEATLALPVKVGLLAIYGEQVAIAETSAWARTVIKQALDLLHILETKIRIGGTTYIRAIVLGGIKLGALLRAVIELNRK